MNLNNIKKRGSEQNEHNPRILQSSGLKMADSSSTHLTFPRKTDNIPPPPHPIVLLANSLALLVLPQLIIVGTIAIPLSASSLSWQQDQVGWMCATIILSMLAFSSPVGLINIMHSKPWITKGAVAAYVLAVLANTLSIGLQYFGGVHPIFFGWISAAAIWGFLAVVTSAIFVLDQKKLNQDKTSTAQPTINFKQIVTYTMMTGLAAGLITGGMIAFLIGNRVLEGKHNETLLTIALSLFYATIRLLLPWLAFDYLKLPLGEENRSFMKYQFNSAIDLMVNLSFPAIKNPVAITILIVSKAISFIMSGLWLIHPYSLWMKSEPFPRNPDSHVGLIGKILALCKLRLSKEGSTHEIYQIGTKKELQRWRNVNLEEVETWLDEAKTQFYLRTWAQLSGSVMFISSFTAITFGGNSESYPFKYTVDSSGMLSQFKGPYSSWIRSVNISLFCCILNLTISFALQAAYHRSEPSKKRLNLFWYGFQIVTKPKNLIGVIFSNFAHSVRSLC